MKKINSPYNILLFPICFVCIVFIGAIYVMYGYVYLPFGLIPITVSAFLYQVYSIHYNHEHIILKINLNDRIINIQDIRQIKITQDSVFLLISLKNRELIEWKIAKFKLSEVESFVAEISNQITIYEQELDAKQIIAKTNPKIVEKKISVQQIEKDTQHQSVEEMINYVLSFTLPTDIQQQLRNIQKNYGIAKYMKLYSENELTKMTKQQIIDALRK